MKRISFKDIVNTYYEILRYRWAYLLPRVAMSKPIFHCIQAVLLSTNLLFWFSDNYLFTLLTAIYGILNTVPALEPLSITISDKYLKISKKNPLKHY